MHASAREYFASWYLHELRLSGVESTRSGPRRHRGNVTLFGARPGTQTDRGANPPFSFSKHVSKAPAHPYRSLTRSVPSTVRRNSNPSSAGTSYIEAAAHDQGLVSTRNLIW